MGLIHKHLLMKIEFNGVYSYYDDPEFWTMFVDTMITEKLGMKIAIPSKAVLVADPDNYGVTGSANLTTSHIAWHVWSRTEVPVLQFDVYSCQCFDEDALIDWMIQVLGPDLVETIRYKVLDREDVLVYNKVIKRR